jgi:hypothetical protein
LQSLTKKINFFPAEFFPSLVIKTLDPDSLEMLNPDPNPDPQHYKRQSKTKGVSEWQLQQW